MKRRGRQRSKDVEEIDDYEHSDSEGLDDEDQQLLDNAVGRRSQEGEEEVLGVYSSSDDSGGEEIPGGDVDSNGSESEGRGQTGEDGLPDPKAWGPDRKQYYHTDYVDKDYLGFDDELAAIAEEGEAAAVQRRLLAHLDGVDFSLGLFQQIENKKVEERAMASSSPKQRVEEVAVDLGSLSSSELLHVLQREAPHLLPILTHCKKHVNYLKTLIPVLELCKEAGRGMGAVTAIRLIYSLILHYSTNVLLLVHLEESGEGGQGHPLLRRIAGLRLLIEELQPVVDKLSPQLDWINQRLAQVDQVSFQWDTSKQQQQQLPNNRKERRKRKLELLKKREEQSCLVESKKRKLMRLEEVLEKRKVGRSETEEHKIGKPRAEDQDQELFSGGEETEDEGEDMQKRGVTFQILKNRGLTPRRKKENRNPRVKHRNKFRRALKRRRGQVREARKEVDKYGGEISGIKKYISKSIKLK